MAELLTVHDPRGYPPKVVGKRLAQRPESLDDKTLYLVDCLFDNSENFMRELADWFGKNLPSIRTRLIQPRQSWVDDAENGAVPFPGDLRTHIGVVNPALPRLDQPRPDRG